MRAAGGESSNDGAACVRAINFAGEGRQARRRTNTTHILVDGMRRNGRFRKSNISRSQQA